MTEPNQEGYKLSKWEVTTSDKRMRQLINITSNVLRDVVAQYQRPVFLWAGGKDGTVLLHIMQSTFESTHGGVPFPVIHVDTKRKHRETINFQDSLAKAYKLDFKRVSNPKAIMRNVNPKTFPKTECCTQLKTMAMNKFLLEYKADCVITAIRWDEHPIRSKSNYIEEKEKLLVYDDSGNEVEVPLAHVRAYPILDWTMENIWDYYAMYNKKYNILYDYVMCPMCMSSHVKELSKGYHCVNCNKDFEIPWIYQSLGCVDCTAAIPRGSAERAGRAQDKEHEEAFELLKKLGYMG